MVKINQSGGSASAILVVVLLLLVIGGGGAAYYITQDESKAEEIDKKAKEKRDAAARRRKEAQERAAELEAEEADKCDDVDCGDNGECDGGVCVCNEGWTGDNCEEEVVEEEEEENTFVLSFDASGREITPEPTPDESTGTCAETRDLEPTMRRGLTMEQREQIRSQDDFVSFYKYEDDPEKSESICAHGPDSINEEWNACERDEWMNTRYNLPGNEHSWIPGAHKNWTTITLPINDKLELREQIALEKWIDQQCPYPGSDGVDLFGNPVKSGNNKDCSLYEENDINQEISTGKCDENPACVSLNTDKDGNPLNIPICVNKTNVFCSSDINGISEGETFNPQLFPGADDRGVIYEESDTKDQSVFLKDDNGNMLLRSQSGDNLSYQVPDTGDLTNGQIYYGLEKGVKWKDLKDGQGTHISRDYMNSYIKVTRDSGANPLIDKGENPRWVHLCDCSAGGNPFTNCFCKSGTYLDINGTENDYCSSGNMEPNNSEGYTCCLYQDDNPCHLKENSSQPDFTDTQGGGGINSLLNALHIGDYYNFDNPLCNIKGGDDDVKGLVYPSDNNEKKGWINKCCPSCSYKRFKNVGDPNSKAITGEREKCGKDVHFKYIRDATEKLKTDYVKKNDEHERTNAQEWEYIDYYLKDQSGCFYEDDTAHLCGDGTVDEQKCYPCRKREDRAGKGIPRNEKYNPTDKGCKSLYGLRYNENETSCTPPPFEGPHLCPLVPNPSRIADGTCDKDWTPTQSPTALPVSLERNVVPKPELPTYNDIIDKAIEIANEDDKNPCANSFNHDRVLYYGEDDNENGDVPYTGMGDKTEFQGESTYGLLDTKNAYDDSNAPHNPGTSNTCTSNEAGFTRTEATPNMCTFPKQPSKPFTGGKLYPSNVYAEGDNSICSGDKCYTGKWTSLTRTNMLTGGEIEHNLENYLDESDDYLPENVAVHTNGIYSWSLRNFAGHNDIDNNCKGDNGEDGIVRPEYLPMVSSQGTDSGNNKKMIPYGVKKDGGDLSNRDGNNCADWKNTDNELVHEVSNEVIMGQIGVPDTTNSWSHGIGTHYGQDTDNTNNNKPMRVDGRPGGLTINEHQMRIALRRRAWSDRFRNGRDNNSYLPSGFNSRSPFYLMTNSNSDSINHSGLLSSDNTILGDGANTSDDTRKDIKENLMRGTVIGLDESCKSGGCNNDESYEHIRNNMSQCQRTNFFHRNVDVPSKDQIRKSYGSSMPYGKDYIDKTTGSAGIWSTSNKDAAVPTNVRDVRRLRPAPYTLAQGSNFSNSENSNEDSGYWGDAFTGDNRTYKNMYYKMLSTYDGKPEGVWFRKDDYTMFDYSPRHWSANGFTSSAHRSPRPNGSHGTSGHSTRTAYAWHDGSAKLFKEKGWDHTERFESNVDKIGPNKSMKMNMAWGDWRETTSPVSSTGDSLKALPRYLAGASYTGGSKGNRGDKSKVWSKNQAKNSQAIAMWNGKINVPMHGTALVHGDGGWYREVYVRPRHRDHKYYKAATNKNRS